MSKKLLYNLLAVLMLASLILSACGKADAPASDAKIVGISMPNKTSTRWISDGESMVKSFEALGYETDLQFAGDDIPNQLAQIENMVTKGADVLVIAAIDGSTLSDVLQKAKDAGVLVVAYDRLISKTANVDYYATFDNFGVGVIQGTQIETGLDLKNAAGPFNVELFGGSPDDTNAFYFYDGAMSVLQPYIDSGKVVIQSGQMGMDKVGTLRWDGTVAQARMDNLLSANYTDKRVDAVLSPYDGLSRGIISSLRGVGYGTADQPWPVITGQDAEVASVIAMIAGEQTYTVFKDTRELAAQTAKMVDQALKGEKVDVNDTKTYDNGVKVVDSYLLTPYSVDITNYEKLLIDSGYIKAEDLPAAPVAEAPAEVYTYETMTIGFLQTGSEGGWRAANTASFKETAEQLGINLKFYDSQNDLAKQVAGFQQFIEDPEVDVIAISPLEAAGWEQVLKDAKAAGKPVILSDRRIDGNEDLYVTFVGADFVEEGRKSGTEMCKLLEGSASKNVWELVGNVGSSPAIDRGKGFRETAEKCGIVITNSQTGNWSIVEGKQVTEAWLKESKDVQGIFGQNDEMAFGAIEALKEAGLVPAVDVKIISVDATAGAFQAMLDGTLNVTVECNPLIAPQVYEAALAALNGETLPKWIPSIEGVFYADDPNLAEIAAGRKY